MRGEEMSEEEGGRGIGRGTYGLIVSVPRVAAGKVTVAAVRTTVVGIVTVVVSVFVTTGVTVPVAVTIDVTVIVVWVLTTVKARAKPISGKKIV
jgi:hypothetical protein